MKNQTFRMTMLFDFYGELLTDRQKEFYDLYYNEDLSLSEIAENYGISRQGERDDIVRILSPKGAPLGVGRISCDSATARRNLGRKGLKPLIHCDYLYLE